MPDRLACAVHRARPLRQSSYPCGRARLPPRLRHSMALLESFTCIDSEGYAASSPESISIGIETGIRLVAELSSAKYLTIGIGALAGRACASTMSRTSGDRSADGCDAAQRGFGAARCRSARATATSGSAAAAAPRSAGCFGRASSTTSRREIVAGAVGAVELGLVGAGEGADQRAHAVGIGDREGRMRASAPRRARASPAPGSPPAARTICRGPADRRA